MYRLKVRLARVVDLSSEDALTRVGTTRQEVFQDDRVASQRIGEAVAWLGFGGLLVPSARAPGTNLVVFVNALSVDDVIEVVDDS